MISVEINLDPFGDVESRLPLALIAIWNDGTGDIEFGNYKWAVSHQFDSAFGQRAAKKSGIDEPGPHDLTGGGPWVWKKGELTGFKRQAGAAALLGRVLRAARL